MIFWWRRWIEHSRSPRATTVPWMSPRICTSTWRPRSTKRSTNTVPSPNAAAASRRALATASARASGSSHDPHPPSAAAGRRLHQHRKADRCHRGRRVGRVAVEGDVVEHRHPGGAHDRLGTDLGAHRGDRRRRWSDPHQPGVEHRLGEGGGLGEEAVAGVDRVGAGAPSGVDEQLGAQVGVGGRRPGQPHREVARAHVQRIGVGVAEHGDGRHAEAPAGAGDAAGDLAAVGDQQGADGRDGRGHGYIRNTP